MYRGGGQAESTRRKGRVYQITGVNALNSFSILGSMTQWGTVGELCPAASKHHMMAQNSASSEWNMLEWPLVPVKDTCAQGH